MLSSGEGSAGRPADIARSQGPHSGPQQDNTLLEIRETPYLHVIELYSPTTHAVMIKAACISIGVKRTAFPVSTSASLST